MKSILFIFIAVTVVFATGMFLLRQALDTKSFISQTCAHTEKTTAKLYWKPSDTYYCYWQVEGDEHLSADWDSCRDYEEGQTIPWERISYDCGRL